MGGWDLSYDNNNVGCRGLCNSVYCALYKTTVVIKISSSPTLKRWSPRPLASMGISCFFVNVSVAETSEISWKETTKAERRARYISNQWLKVQYTVKTHQIPEWAFDCKGFVLSRYVRRGMGRFLHNNCCNVCSSEHFCFWIGRRAPCHSPANSVSSYLKRNDHISYLAFIAEMISTFRKINEM